MNLEYYNLVAKRNKYRSGLSEINDYLSKVSNALSDYDLLPLAKNYTDTGLSNFEPSRTIHYARKNHHAELDQLKASLYYNYTLLVEKRDALDEALYDAQFRINNWSEDNV